MWNKFQKNLPKIEPFKGIFTVDTTAYYPEDRGIVKVLNLEEL